MKKNKLYSIIDIRGSHDSEIEDMENAIFKNFPNFKKLGTIFMKNHDLFKTQTPKNKIGEIVICEPFLIIAYDQDSWASEIMQTYNGETVIGFNRFYSSEDELDSIGYKPLANFEISFSYGDNYLKEYAYYGE